MARLLGRESVSSDIAALFELVKNGYDADASLVTITFEDFDKELGRLGKITIFDDGQGMSRTDVEEKWLVIGTDSKEIEPFTRKHRIAVGNKGIGRFGTEKLAKKVTLISKPQHNEEIVTLVIDWTLYEGRNVTFDDIPLSMNVEKREKKKDYGTTVILENLRERWTTEKIDKLKIAVASLILPEQLQKATKDIFNIKIIAKDFQSTITPDVHSILLKNAPYRITASLPKNREDFKVTIYKENKIIRTEQVEMSDIILDNAEYWKQFGKCKLNIYFFPGRSRHEDWTNYYKKALNINNIREALTAIHGVKIYRDGFWVRPYGETGNDWLSLESERVQTNYKIGNSQIVGFVEIGKDDNPNILDTTTRERLVENESFHSLRGFVKETIDVMNNHRKEENKKKKDQKARLEHKNIIESEVQMLKEEIDNSTISSEHKKEFKKSLNNITKVFSDFKEETDETTQELEISERAYRNLASLGISSATTSHEMNYILPHLELLLSSIHAKLKQQTESLHLVEDDIHTAVNKINAIKHFATFIITFVDNLAYDNEIKHSKETINLKTTLQKLINEFVGIIETRDLDLKWQFAPDRISVYMNKADIESVILNLFSNSLKSLQKVGKDKWKIKISVIKDAKKLTIKFSDNGSGIKDSHKDKIFRMFFTTQKQGTGLGLTIVKEIIDEYGGKVEIMPYSELEDGATFKITIPAENLKK